MWIEDGNGFSFSIPLMVDGVPVLPDGGSVVATIRGMDGTILSNWNNVTVTTTGNYVVLATSGADNTLADSLATENRFVLIRFNYQNNPIVIRESYQISPFIPMTVTPKDVRAAIGLFDNELDDLEVNLIQAYYELADQYGDDFKNALSTAGLKSIKANEAIRYQAAINLAPSLQTRIAQIHKTESNQVSRWAYMDINQLVNDLMEMLAVSVSNFVNSAIPAKSIFLVSAPTDPVTGA